MHKNGQLHTLSKAYFTEDAICCQGEEKLPPRDVLLSVSQERDACVDILVEGAGQSLHQTRSDEVQPPLPIELSVAWLALPERPVFSSLYSIVQPRAPPVRTPHIHLSVPSTVLLI